MNKEDVTTLQKAAADIGMISRAISIIQYSEDLYIANDDVFHSSFSYDGVIKIPESLKAEFKKKLLEYFAGKYNEYVSNLKNIEL
jgi:hypothetical protein